MLRCFGVQPFVGTYLAMPRMSPLAQQSILRVALDSSCFCNESALAEARQHNNRFTPVVRARDMDGRNKL